MMARRVTLAAALTLLVALVVTLAVLANRGGSSDASQGGGGEGAAQAGWTTIAGPGAEGTTPAAAELAAIPGDPGVMRVDPELPPPTNRWYSGMLFGDQPQPVFAVPLALLAEDDAVTIGLPQVTTTAATIAAPFVPHLRLGLPTDGFAATAADPVSVTVTYEESGRPSGAMRTAAGWPYVAYEALADQTVTLPEGLTPRDDGQWLALTDPSGTYGLAVTDADGERVTAPVQGTDLSLAAGQTVLLFAAPDAAVGALAAHAVPLTGVETSYAVTGETAGTQLRYLTAGDRPTVFATMPHHGVGQSPDAQPVGEIGSIWGPLQLQVGTTLRATVPTLQPASELDLSGLDEAARAQLSEQVTTDARALAKAPASPTDTYFGGKALQRDAQLYRLARALSHPDTESIRTRVVADLDAWLGEQDCTPSRMRCFAYDPRFRGVVGREPSFGSEQFNDHHFHYGYFLTAGALMAETDPTLAARWAPRLAALAEDIAAPEQRPELPALRVFDPYAGHSWASGTAPFADGNNQESSSEAVNAWNGLALWARVTGDEPLAARAAWLLSLEAATARAYWVQPTLPAGFEHEVVALNWGGKRDWATWFSAEPSAMLGIQLLPMGPVSQYLAGDPDRIRANVAEAAPDGFDTMFGDYLVMYLALADPQAALAAAESLPAKLDDGL
ncbi:MAG TPA: glycosyl hydrolase, partial [Candidatus Nanopelagicales bacterium]